MHTKNIQAISSKIKRISNHITSKYYEVDDFVKCLLVSMISRTHLIVLGEPGIAKSAILRELVDHIDFENHGGTPYFHIQMGADISPNNIFGAPDIAYFKTHGIIKRHYKGFLPDAVIAFCSEFYRVSDQVANSGLLTILNEGEFKNGVDTIRTPLRFFMADTNFFPKQKDDLDAEEVDFKLQALHDRFLARYYLEPLQDYDNKIQMILMDDTSRIDDKLTIDELIFIQDQLTHVVLERNIAASMVEISEKLVDEHHIFISPRRLKLSRNLVKANALLNGRNACIPEDLNTLTYAFWQRKEDIVKVKEVIHSILEKPAKDAARFLKVLDSILEELDRHIEDEKDLPNFNIDALYGQAITDLVKLRESVDGSYPYKDPYPEIKSAEEAINKTYARLIQERNVL